MADKSLKIIANVEEKGLSALETSINRITKAGGKLGDVFKNISQTRGVTGGFGEFAQQLQKHEKTLISLGVTTERTMRIVRDAGQKAWDDQKERVKALRVELEKAVDQFEQVEKRVSSLRSKGVSPDKLDNIINTQRNRIIEKQTNLTGAVAAEQSAAGAMKPPGNFGGVAAGLGTIGVVLGAAMSAMAMSQNAAGTYSAWTQNPSSQLARGQSYTAQAMADVYGGNTTEGLARLTPGYNDRIGDAMSNSAIGSRLWSQGSLKPWDPNFMKTVAGAALYMGQDTLASRLYGAENINRETNAAGQEAAAQLTGNEKASVGYMSNLVDEYVQKAVMRNETQARFAGPNGLAVRTGYLGESSNMAQFGSMVGALGNARANAGGVFGSIFRASGIGMGAGDSARIMGGMGNAYNTGGDYQAQMGKATHEFENMLTRAYVKGITDPQALTKLGDAVSNGTMSALGRSDQRVTGQMLGDQLGRSPDAYKQASVFGGFQKANQFFGGGDAYWKVQKRKTFADILSQSGGNFDATDTALLGDMNMNELISGQAPQELRERIGRKAGGLAQADRIFQQGLKQQIENLLFSNATKSSSKKALRDAKAGGDIFDAVKPGSDAFDDITGFMKYRMGTSLGEGAEALEFMNQAYGDPSLRGVSKAQRDKALKGHWFDFAPVKMQTEAEAQRLSDSRTPEAKTSMEAVFKDNHERLKGFSQDLVTAGKSVLGFADLVVSAGKKLGGGGGIGPPRPNPGQGK